MGARRIDGLTEVEAVDLLLRLWNPGAKQTRALTLELIDALLAVTADGRQTFENRHITSLADAEQCAVQQIYSYSDALHQRHRNWWFAIVTSRSRYGWLQGD